MTLPQHDDIVTPRLRLITITPSMLKSEQSSDGRLGELIKCAIPANWPPIDWEPHVFDFILSQFERYPEQIGWHRYVSFRHPNGSHDLIGALGAFSKEATPTECEIGYSILPPFDGRGLATEGTQALISFLRNAQHLTSIIAHTFPSLPASIRVMEKCGLAFEGNGEEAGTIRYRLHLRPPK